MPGLLGAQHAPIRARPPQQHGGGFGRTIGRIGDVLAVLGGREPVYTPMERQNEAQDALAAYASNPEDQSAFMGLLMRSPELALRIKEGLSPRRNDTIDDFEWFKRLGPEDRATYREMHPIYRQGPDGQFYAVAPAQTTLPPDTLPPDFDFGGGAPASASPPFGGSQLDHITMMSESGGNPNAVSPAGARGLMQVMPGTARDPGFGIRPSSGTQQDDVRLGREYRAAMQQRYGGDLRKMWAAYNWGPGNLDRAIALYGENGWWQHAPAETRAYVAQNLRALGNN